MSTQKPVHEFIGASFVRAKLWKQTKWQSVDEQVNTVHSHNGILLSKKKDE